MKELLKMTACASWPLGETFALARVAADKEKTVENYIVRIYRFQKDNPRKLVGIVESVENEGRGKRAFTNLDDLWEILNSQMSETGPPSKGKPSRRSRHLRLGIHLDSLMGLTMKTIVDARGLPKAERVLLIGHTIKKGSSREIVVLADGDKAREDISHAARNEGWMLKGVEPQEDGCRIIITPALPLPP